MEIPDLSMNSSGIHEGGGTRIRVKMVKSHLLYQLSYAPEAGILPPLRRFRSQAQSMQRVGPVADEVEVDLLVALPHAVEVTEDP